MNLERSPVTVTLIVTTVMMYLFYNINPGTFVDIFALDSAHIMDDFLPWQLITYAFYFPQNIVFFFFTVMIYIIIGLNLEQRWGSLRFGIYILILILSRSIAALLLGTSAYVPLGGDLYLDLCLLVAFGFNFPDHEFRLFFFLPVKVKYLAIFGLCIMGIYIFVPLYMLRDAFGMVSPGFIRISAPVAVSVVNAISCIGLLIYWRYIFSHRPVDVVVSKIKENIQVIEQDNKRLLKIHGNKKYADILKDYEHNKDSDTSVLDKFDENNQSLCEAGDFDKDDPYCLECEKYPHCAKRSLRDKKNKE